MPRVTYEDVVAAMLQQFPELVDASNKVADDVRQFGDTEEDPLDPYTQFSEVFVERYLLPSLERGEEADSARALAFVGALLTSTDNRVADLVRIRALDRIRNRPNLMTLAIKVAPRPVAMALEAGT